MEISESNGMRLKTVLQQLHDNPYPHVANPPLCKKRASVALVIRIRPTAPDIASYSPQSVSPASVSFAESLTSFWNQDWVRRGDAEILFIKRAARVGDRWTGHVALPGGKREPSDSNDQKAASRETREEVGLDLETDHCLFIGNLPERVITTNWGKVPIMVLCPFVYLLLRHDVPPLTLQPTEVHSTHWVPIRGLLSPSLRTNIRADVSDRLKKQRGPSMKQAVRAAIGQLVFSATVLTPSESLVCSSAPGFIPAPSSSPNFSISTLSLGSLIPWKQPPHTDGPYILWGLTLGIIADLLQQVDPQATSTLCDWPTFSHWDIRFMLWILTRKLRTPSSTEADMQATTDGSEVAALKVKGIDDTTFATSRWRPGPPAAHFPDEYFRLMRTAVVSALVVRSNIIAALAIMAIFRYRLRNMRS